MVIGGKTGKVIREYTEKRMSETPPRNSTTVTQHYDPEMQFKGVDKTVTTNIVTGKNDFKRENFK